MNLKPLPGDRSQGWSKQQHHHRQQRRQGKEEEEEERQKEKEEGNFVSHVASSFVFPPSGTLHQLKVGSNASPELNAATPSTADAASLRHPPLPRYIKPLSSELRTEDWEYLSAKRCFSFPPFTFERCIIERFIGFVYPFLPVLDMDEFVAIITGKSHKQVSLVLYHAVMGAGVAAVDVDTIVQHGYASKIAARDDFYTRAKVQNCN